MLKYVMLCLVVMVSIVGCKRKGEYTDSSTVQKPAVDIKMTTKNVELTVLDNQHSARYLAKVFEWKGHEYMVSYDGFILHTESCPCKESKR